MGDRVASLRETVKLVIAEEIRLDLDAVKASPRSEPAIPRIHRSVEFRLPEKFSETPVGKQVFRHFNEPKQREIFGDGHETEEGVMCDQGLSVEA